MFARCQLRTVASAAGDSAKPSNRGQRQSPRRWGIGWGCALISCHLQSPRTYSFPNIVAGCPKGARWALSALSPARRRRRLPLPSLQSQPLRSQAMHLLMPARPIAASACSTDTGHCCWTARTAPWEWPTGSGEWAPFAGSTMLLSCGAAGRFLKASHTQHAPTLIEDKLKCRLVGALAAPSAWT
jgi:hypothetical protein